jgi:hypothetical protein
MPGAAEAMEQYFAYLRSNGESAIDGPVLWAFTFNSLPEAQLEEFRTDVEASGFAVEFGQSKNGSFIGEVTHVKQHSPATLAERWTRFEGIVNRHPPCALGGISFRRSTTSAP